MTPLNVLFAVLVGLWMLIVGSALTLAVFSGLLRWERRGGGR